MTSRSRSATTLVLFAFLAAGLAACGGPARGKVRGKVTFQGQPVTEGTVTFIEPETGHVAEAKLDNQGAYTVKGGLVVGKYTVMVNPPIVIEPSTSKTPPSPVEKEVKNIPARYRNQGNTPLKGVKVEKGENKHDFELKP